jgi:membrane associated rhomboid family serine protease
MNTILIAIIIALALKALMINLFRKYEFHMGSVRAGEQIRLISSAFLHADIAHLAFNMITLTFRSSGDWLFG